MTKIKTIFNIPNLLSIARVTILPIAVIIIKNNSNNYNIISISVLLFMLLTDFFDGFTARKLNLVTSLGKILDPLSDKIVILLITYLLARFRGFPFWAFYIILAREILILTGGVILFKSKNIIPSSNFVGKGATFFISLSILGYIFLSKQYQNISYIFLIIGVSFYFLSFFSYSIRYLRIMDIVPGLKKYKIIKNSRLF